MFPPGLFGWIALALLFLALGVAFGNAVLLTGAVFVLLTVMIATSLTPPTGIVVERRLPRVICWAGDTLDVERRLTAQSGVGPIFVHDVLPPEIEVAGGNNLRVVWKWPGVMATDLSYQVRFPKRGEYTFPETTWESRAPFGTGRGRSGAAGATVAVVVAPRIRGITRLNEVRATTKKSLYQDDIAQAGVSSNEFRQLRPYLPGDPIKSINWKASARGSTGDNMPLVNELEPEGKKAVWIFLDIANYMDVGTPLSNPMENTIEAAGSLAQFYLSQGSTLGAYAYNSSGSGGELLSPDSGQKQFRRLTQLLAGLKPGLPQHDLLKSVEWCKSFLLRLQPEVFIITRVDIHYPRPGEPTESLDRFTAAINRLAALRARSRRRGRVRVVHVSPREVYADSSLAMPGANLAQWETRPLAASLRKSGAAVMEWVPAREHFITVLVRHMDTFR